MVHCRTVCGVVAVVFLVVICSAAHSQRASDDSPLVVDGMVRQIYRSTDQGRSELLVQIDVSRSEARGASEASKPLRFPAPGEPLYVHVFREARPGSPADGNSLPAEGTKVRAYLKPRAHGGWEGASAAWIQPLEESVAKKETSPDDLARVVIEKPNRSASLGMTTELLKVEDRYVLRVTSVERGGPAQAAGLEVGDVVAAADGKEITSPNQLAEVAASGEPVSLVVVDVNSGRGARVELNPRGKPSDAKTADTAPAEEPQSPPVSLGLSAEPVKLGMRGALKVIRVDPAGPAAKAGIEPDDILVAANGTPTTGVEQLLSALRKSGPTLKLTVRDSRTGRDVDVDVNLGAIAKSAPAEVETPIKPSAGTLGAVTELAFHDSDFAVKVTEVEPGSAAARAGLRPGLLIIAADGKPVLHPNDLNDAVRNSSGALKLTVVEPSSGKKSDLNVALR